MELEDFPTNLTPLDDNFSSGLPDLIENVSLEKWIILNLGEKIEEDSLCCICHKILVDPKSC